MNDELTMRFSMIRRYCNADAGALHPLLTDIAACAQGVTALAASHFPPQLLPATAWISPLQAAVTDLFKAGER